MITGHLDAVTTSGYIEGWALDLAILPRPIEVGIKVAGRDVAFGLANRFRRDLVEAGVGFGWSAFRLKLSIDPTVLLQEPALLFALHTETEILTTVCPAMLEDSEMAVSSISEISAADPTSLNGIAQLEGCAGLFDDFIDAEGVDAFVARAFGYVLGRPADEASVTRYAAALRSAALTPYDVLTTLAESEEFRRAPAIMLAPTEPGFAFRRP